MKSKLSTIKSLDRSLAIALGQLANVVCELEQTRPRGFDVQRTEANRAMAATMKLAGLLKFRPDPIALDALGFEIHDGRPMLSGELMGENNRGFIVRVYDPFELIYRWHELEAGCDLSRPSLCHPERPSPASPLSRGYYLRVTPSHDERRVAV